MKLTPHLHVSGKITAKAKIIKVPEGSDFLILSLQDNEGYEGEWNLVFDHDNTAILRDVAEQLINETKRLTKEKVSINNLVFDKTRMAKAIKNVPADAPVYGPIVLKGYEVLDGYRRIAYCISKGITEIEAIQANLSVFCASGSDTDSEWEVIIKAINEAEARSLINTHLKIKGRKDLIAKGYTVGYLVIYEDVNRIIKSTVESGV